MAPLEVRFRRLRPEDSDLPLPQRMSELAAGMDLRAAVSRPVRMEPGARALVPTGFAVEIPAGYEGQVRPRSGLALRHGVTCLNSPGTIDADYRGELSVILVNHGSEPFSVARGDRIAQLVICRVPEAVAVEADELTGTERGEGGFGSSGV